MKYLYKNTPLHDKKYQTSLKQQQQLEQNFTHTQPTSPFLSLQNSMLKTKIIALQYSSQIRSIILKVNEQVQTKERKGMGSKVIYRRRISKGVPIHLPSFARLCLTFVLNCICLSASRKYLIHIETLPN